MQDLTAHQRPDGMFELRPVFPECASNNFEYYAAWEKNKVKFEQANPPIPADDKDLVEGQKVDKGDYEEVWQYLDNDIWKDFPTDDQDHLDILEKVDVYRQILRKKSNLPSVQPIAESHIKPEFEGKELYMDGEWKQVEPIADKGESKAYDAFLLHLIDIVWGIAHENNSVPSTVWAKEMIAKAKETFIPCSNG